MGHTLHGNIGCRQLVLIAGPEIKMIKFSLLFMCLACVLGMVCLSGLPCANMIELLRVKQVFLGQGQLTETPLKKNCSAVRIFLVQLQMTKICSKMSIYPSLVFFYVGPSVLCSLLKVRHVILVEIHDMHVVRGDGIQIWDLFLRPTIRLL